MTYLLPNFTGSMWEILIQENAFQNGVCFRASMC